LDKFLFGILLTHFNWSNKMGFASSQQSVL